MKLALATCEALPELDADDAALVGALRARGVGVEPWVWTRGVPDADLVVIRSTWDYVPRRDEFVDWVGRCRRVVNSVAVVRWNTDKRYLAELAARGVGVVPTTYVAPGQAYVAPAVEHVVKPTVSAGAKNTRRHRASSAESAAHVAALHAEDRTAMVQPYIASVDARGETALIFFGGEFSHAISKAALLQPGAAATAALFATETIVARAPTVAELALAKRAVAAAPEPLVYARVDVVATADGDAVLELEATEPSLFFGFAPGAAERFADVLLRSP